MNKSSLDKMINTALPYFVGGAVLYVFYKRFFSRNVNYIKEKIKTAEVQYLTMTDLEKEEYASKQVSILRDTLGSRLFSRFRNNDDIVEIVRGNRFCIKRMGNIWYNSKCFICLSLSDYLHYSLSDSDFIKIHEEIDILRESGL